MLYKRLPALLYQLSSACLMCCAILIFLDTSKLANSIYPFILIPYGVTVYAVNLIFLRKPREMASVLLLNALIFVPTLSLIIFSAELRGFLALMFAVLFMLWISGIAFVNVSRGTGINTLMLCVEISMMMLVIFVAFCAVNDFDTEMYLLPVAACSFAIIAVTMQRMDSKPSLRSGVFLIAVFALIFALLWVMVSFVAAPAGSGLVSVWRAFTALLASGVKLLERFLAFLAGLLPVINTELPPPDAAAGIAPAGEAAPVESSAAVLYILVGFVAAAAAMLLYKLRHIKLSAADMKTEAAHAKSRSSFTGALLKLMRKIYGRIAFEIKLVKERKSPEAALIRIMRICRKSPLKKQQGETVKEFLGRIAALSNENRRLKENLGLIADLAERVLFSGRKENAIVDDLEYTVFAIRMLVVKYRLLQLRQSQK